MSKLGTAIITGASAGMGVCYANRLAERGYDLVLVARSGDKLTALAETITKTYGVKADTMTIDLTKLDEVRQVEARLRDDASVTLMVNNAGMGTPRPVLEESIDFLEDTVISLNVLACHRLSIAAAQAFVARGKGGIINLASIAVLHPYKTNATYTAVKAFTLNMSESLYHTLKPHGIHVQCVLPGATATEFFNRIGMDLEGRFPKEKVMSAADLVDAALAGYDMGEAISIPSLPEPERWEAVIAARNALEPDLSHNKPAARYNVGAKIEA